jgi:hypothetical protein
MMQQMGALGTKFGEVSAYFEPEVLQIPKEKIDQYLKEKPELAKEYDIYIDNIQRLRDHTLTEPSKLEEMNNVGSPTVSGTPLIPGYSAKEPISFICAPSKELINLLFSENFHTYTYPE